MIGLSIARELCRTGISNVTIIDSGLPGRGSSWAAAGMLGANVECDRGSLFYDLCIRSRDLFPSLAIELLETTGIDIGLDRHGTLSLAMTEFEFASMKAEFSKTESIDAELLSATDVRRAEPFVSPDVLGAVFHRGDWQVDNRELVRALIADAERSGVNIIANTRVESVIVDSGKAVGIIHARGNIMADTVIVANGAWGSLIKFGDAVSPLLVKPIRGQIVEFHTAKRLFDHVLHTRRGYLVPRMNGRILVGATTEDVGFDESTTDAARSELSAAAFEISPSLANLIPSDHWSGLRPFAADAMPVIGRPSGIGNLLVATAHYRNGILLAPETARLIASAVIGGIEPVEFTAFGPERLRFVANI